jgi:hypothetical protein
MKYDDFTFTAFSVLSRYTNKNGHHMGNHESRDLTVRYTVKRFLVNYDQKGPIINLIWFSNNLYVRHHINNLTRVNKNVSLSTTSLNAISLVQDWMP